MHFPKEESFKSLFPLHSQPGDFFAFARRKKKKNSSPQFCGAGCKVGKVQRTPEGRQARCKSREVDHNFFAACLPTGRRCVFARTK
jgi:hypothetical protein